MSTAPLLALLLLVCASSLALTLVLLLRRSQHVPGFERALQSELRAGREEQVATLTRLAGLQQRQLEVMTKQLERLREGNERTLGESFARVSERLEAVQRGLGEMQSLAGGVGDLKRVLTNVKTRGVWGEYQLGAILEQILTPDQYCANYRPRPEAGEAVEFAIRLPGNEADGYPVHLPIDAKFPQEDYQRLLDAAERADGDTVAAATAGLVRTVRTCARDIREKYLAPPATTDFAIMFLPTEGLYAEVLRQPGLVQEVHGSCHVVIAGPTTLAAIVSSLRMGFRTLAIERRSSEVWQVLGAVKTEFNRFGEVLDRVKKQLVAASNTIEDTGRRTRAMERRLRRVEELSPDLAATVLGLNGEGGSGAGDGGAGEDEALEEPPP